MIRLLPNPEFLQWILLAISKVQKRIVIVNYLAAMDVEDRTGPVALIARELARACKRGLKVEVVLEGSKFRENYAFYRVLKDSGVDVWMDTSLTFIHTKAVLIDESLLCVGSHNLSASALTTHHELSAAFRDRAAVKRFHAELARMTKQRRQIKGTACKKGVKISIESLVRIKRSASPHAYLLYLLLCREDGGRPRPIVIDAEKWAAELGLPSSVASANVRVATILDLMDNKLGVLKHDRKRNTVLRLKPSALRPKPSYVFLPSTFWKFGWHRRLSVEAIHFYFSGEAETIASPFAPWWRLKRDDVAAKYGFQKQLVNRAQMELRRAGLLEIVFETGMAPAGRFARQMNYYRENPFYDRTVLEGEMRRIAGRYPPSVYAVAARLLDVVCEDSDLQKMITICDLVSKRGVARARRILTAVTRLAPNSTKRNFGYIRGCLATANPPSKGVDSETKVMTSSHRWAPLKTHTLSLRATSRSEAIPCKPLIYRDRHVALRAPRDDIFRVLEISCCSIGVIESPITNHGF